MKKTFKKDDVPQIAKEIVASLKSGESATVVALMGDLGAGKTTLTQAIALELGIQENVISPTFVIMKSYPITGGTHEKLVHIDAYRLHGGHELLKLGWSELIADPKNLVFIEWPERVFDIIPGTANSVSLTHISEEERGIESNID